MRKKKKSSFSDDLDHPTRSLKYPEYISGMFEGEEVHVVGSGPSLVGFDYGRLKGKKVIAINNAYKLVPHEFGVFTDKGFARRESPEVIKETTCVTRFDNEFPNHIVFEFADGRDGRADRFQLDPAKGVWHRSSSGSIGICAALQGGASNVYIYGFDCRFFSFDEVLAAAKLNGITSVELKKLEDRISIQKKRTHPKTEMMAFQHFAHATSSLEGFDHEREDKSSEQAFKDSVKWFAGFPRDMIINMSKNSAIPYFNKSARPYVD